MPRQRRGARRGHVLIKVEPRRGEASFSELFGLPVHRLRNQFDLSLRTPGPKLHPNLRIRRDEATPNSP